MKFNSVWKVKVPRYLGFLIIILIASGFAFSIVVKAQKRAALIVEENRFFYWKKYNNAEYGLSFSYPSNFIITKKGTLKMDVLTQEFVKINEKIELGKKNQFLILDDFTRRGDINLEMLFNPDLPGQWAEAEKVYEIEFKKGRVISKKEYYLEAFRDKQRKYLKVWLQKRSGDYIILNFSYNQQGPDYESEFELILDSIKLKDPIRHQYSID